MKIVNKELIARDVLKMIEECQLEISDEEIPELIEILLKNEIARDYLKKKYSITIGNLFICDKGAL